MSDATTEDTPADLKSSLSDSRRPAFRHARRSPSKASHEAQSPRDTMAQQFASGRLEMQPALAERFEPSKLIAARRAGSHACLLIADAQSELCVVHPPFKSALS